MIQELVDAIPEAVIVCDGRTQTIVSVNPAAVEIFGYSKEEMLTFRVSDLVPDDLRSKHDQLVDGYGDAPQKRVMGSGLPLFGKTKSGDSIPLDIALGPYESEGTFYVVALITKRREEDQRTRLVAILTNLLTEIKAVKESIDPANEQSGV